MPVETSTDALSALDSFLASTNPPASQPITLQSTNATKGSQNIADLLAPLARQAADTAKTALNAAPAGMVAQGNVSWIDRNTRMDANGKAIPIDLSNGINMGDYARMVWQRRPEERLDVLRKMFPNQIVRVSDTGEPLVEITDESGKRDVLINPPGFNARDLLEIGSVSPEIVGATVGQALGAAGGETLMGPPGAFIGRALGGAAGAAIGGIGKDLTARSVEGLTIDPNEIAAARSQEAKLNLLWDVSLSTGAKSMRVLSPFAGNKGPLEFNQDEAVKYFQFKQGENLIRTPGERTGNLLLKRIEATEAPQPGASSVIGKIRTQSEEAISRALNRALGRRVSEEDIGNDLVTNLKAKVAAPVEKAVEQARGELIDKGESEIVNLFDNLTRTGPTSTADAGDAVREAFKDRQVAAKAKVDAAYTTVKALPGGSGKMLPADSVAAAAQDIINELPKVDKATPVKSFDAYGNPITRQRISKEVLPSSRPDSLQTFLSDMAKMKGQKMSLDELTKLKNAARDEIARTEAVPGTKDRWFSKVSKAYDDAVQQGVDELGKKQGNTDLADALTKAKETYKTELAPLDREGLHDILRTPFEAGYQSPEQLVHRLFSGARAEHNYNVLSETLGPTSTAFQKVKRSLLDSWLLDASDPLTQRIDPKSLENALLGLRKNHAAIYKDIIGSEEQRLFQITRSLTTAGKEIADLDPKELAQLVSTGNVTRDNVLKLAAAQRVRDTTLSNQVFKQIASDGTLGSVSPVKFVRSLSNTDIPTQDIEDALSQLTVKQREDIQTATLYKILTGASEYKSDYAPAYVKGLLSMVSAKGIAETLGAPGSLARARNELLLGKDNLEHLIQTVNFLAPREVKQQLFGAAGGMAATARIEELLKNPLRYAQTFARKFVVATAYTSKLGQALIANQVEGPKETAAFANLLVSSEPFIRKAIDVLGEKAANSVISDLKQSIDRSLVQDTTPNADQTQVNELMSFLQTGKGDVTVKATNRVR